jgi:hypothetical protein
LWIQLGCWRERDVEPSTVHGVGYRQHAGI